MWLKNGTCISRHELSTMLFSNPDRSGTMSKFLFVFEYTTARAGVDKKRLTTVGEVYIPSRPSHV
jgi:hypothetical protein